MLVESIIRVGRPIVHSNLSNEQRIRWLTDIDSENCKNFFQIVFLVEIDKEKIDYHYVTLGFWKEKKFVVDELRNKAYPILYPQGGNPLHAQGVYPAPCYLMYDPHIKSMGDPKTFEEVILPRLKSTICYRRNNEKQLRSIATRVAKIIASDYKNFISENKQLGILYIYDHDLSIFHVMPERKNDDERYFWIAESKLRAGQHLYIDSDKCLEGIIEAKFDEAKTLGHEKNAISTFTNKMEEEVSSIYNKFWLWLSPTWEMPRSIYWAEDGWTNGIKIDRANYEAFLYGSQFLKQITVPISSGILKEMFAPTMNVEAKKYMRPTSFEKIFGVPIVLPLVSGDSKQLYEKYQRILKNDPGKSESDIHLELLAGIDKVIPETSDDHRLLILYYSGDLSRGDVHVRMVIEDIIPSVAMKLQKIMKDLNRKHIVDIHKAFGSKREENKYFRTRSLPSMLANVYGPGYIWSTLQTVFHRQPIYIDRLYQSTAIKLNELANKEDHWGMVDELIFCYAFIFFYREYYREVLKIEKEVKSMSDWTQLLEKYHMGQITIDDLRSAEELGFVTGLLLKQFSNSYHHKTNKDFIKHRVMKFGSKLTPEMVWKGGVMRCEELAAQWDLKLASNFYSVLPHVLLSLLDADKQNSLSRDKDKFMTAFWSGYLMYRKAKEED